MLLPLLLLMLGLGSQAKIYHAKLQSGIKSLEICSLPKGRGPCDRYELRFFYSTEANQCKYFFYGGCEGNENNFVSVEECQERCEGRNGTGLTTAAPTSSYYERLSTSTMDPTTTEAVLTTSMAPTTSNITQSTTADDKPLPVMENVDICSLPKGRGPCDRYELRFFYSTEANECKYFFYGGCEGNENNFVSWEECQERGEGRNGTGSTTEPPKSPNYERLSTSTVDPTTTEAVLTTSMSPTTSNITQSTTADDKPLPVMENVDICSLPKGRGPCDRYELRFFFSTEANECKYFFYGGCEGNENNFVSVEECQERCERRNGTGSTTTSDYERLSTSTMDPTTTEAVLTTSMAPTTLKITQSSIADDKPLPDMENIDICSLPKGRGPCDRYELRFFFSTEANECKYFFYGGCEGNENNFVKWEECQERCEGRNGAGSTTEPPTSPDYERLSTSTVDPTTTEAVLTTSMSPTTLKITQSAIVDDMPLPGTENIDICSLPKGRGPCDRYELRFFFSTEANVCKYFFYGGCEGNENNFVSVEECQERCEGRNGTVATTAATISPDYDRLSTSPMDPTTTEAVLTLSMAPTTEDSHPTITTMNPTTTNAAHTTTMGPVDAPPINSVPTTNVPPSTTTELDNIPRCNLSAIAEKVREVFEGLGSKRYGYQVLVLSTEGTEDDWSVGTDLDGNYAEIMDYNGLDIHIFRFDRTEIDEGGPKINNFRKWFLIVSRRLKKADTFMNFLQSKTRYGRIYGRDLYTSVLLMRNRQTPVPFGFAVEKETFNLLEFERTDN